MIPGAVSSNYPRHTLSSLLFFLSLGNAEALSSKPTVERKKSILGELPLFFSPVCVRVGFRAYIYIHIHIAQPVVDLSFLLHFYFLPPLFFFWSVLCFLRCHLSPVKKKSSPLLSFIISCLFFSLFL